MKRVKLDLTDEEWMSIIDGDRGGLSRCCANISALRDTLISCARNGGEVSFFNQLDMHLSWCFPDHDIPSPVIQKVIDQSGWKPLEDHTEQGVEF